MAQQISYKFSAIDGISSVARKIGDSVQKIADKLSFLGRMSKKVNRMFKASLAGMRRAINSLAAKLGGLGVAFSAAFGITKIVKTGMDFEDAIIGVSQITGESGEQLKSYSDSIQEIAIKWGKSSVEIAQALTNVASGKSELLSTPKALVAITDKAAELSRATGITVPEAVKAMVGSLNMFDKGAESAGNFSDVLVKGAQVGASVVGEVAEALKNVGSIAASNNISFLETNALLQTMSKAELKGSEAGTGLAGVLKVMKLKLKIDVKKMGISKAIAEVIKLEKLGKIDMTKTFGEHEKSILSLTGKYEFYKSTVEQLTNAENAASNESAKMMKATSAKVAAAQARMSSVMIRVFEKLQPLINKLLDDFEKWSTSLTETDIKDFTKTIGELVVFMRELAEIMAGFAGFVNGLGKGLGRIPAALNTSNLDGLTETEDFFAAMLTSIFPFLYDSDKSSSRKNNYEMPFEKNADKVTQDTKLDITVSAENGTKVTSVKTTSGRQAKTKSNMSSK